MIPDIFEVETSIHDQIQYQVFFVTGVCVATGFSYARKSRRGRKNIYDTFIEMHLLRCTHDGVQ